MRNETILCDKTSLWSFTTTPNIQFFSISFLEGLEAGDLRTEILKYPNQFRKVFCKKASQITAEMIEAVFSKINYSEPGSNLLIFINKIL